MPKVYVIDDSLSVCMAVERMLSIRGIEVVAEKSGLSAVVNLEREAPDLVICDVVLPGIEGFRICSFIKQNPKLAATPVLMISGIVDDEVRQRAREVGSAGILKKPFAADELVQTVDQLLQLQAQAAVSGSPTGLTSEQLHQVLEESARLPALQFAAILDPAGKILHTIGILPAGEDEFATRLSRLATLAFSFAETLRQGSSQGLIVEAEAGLLLARPLPGQFVLVLALSDSELLGKARLVLNRMQRNLQ